MLFGKRSALKIGVGCLLLVLVPVLTWYLKTQFHAYLKDEISRGVVQALTARHRTLDDSIRQQYAPILAKLDTAAKVTQAQHSIPLSGTGTIERLQSTESTTLMKEIAKHFRNRQGKFVVNERILICEDIGSGSMFHLY
jgi:hypothetical protein